MSKDLERFSSTLAYIENHLFEAISLKQLAKQALLSEYTFHRFFTYLTGYSFSNYLRYRRLSEAVELLRKGIPIDEISERCGYANRSAFNRAFSKFHGIAPSQAKDIEAAVNFFPPIRLDIQINGGKMLNYHIEQLPSFTIVGKMAAYQLEDDLFRNTGKHWESFFMDQELRTFAESDATRKSFFGLRRAPYFAVANPAKPQSGYLNYFTGFVLNQKTTSSYLTLEIPKQTYAVFVSDPYDYRKTENVSNAYYQLQQQIFNTWLPQTEYQKIDGPELETYLTLGDSACLEIWLPIKK
ncbi:AraC family transcriptional regulator [Candidatus Enterococcus murrayae]|uniref:AraC family transcriptional regulator n=1 Tax=Candidatus Enterococcus murrayae TaxID=2815321 RepID=A0ABS3HNL4_9ENTE|nr:helix-turn-helix domain-containing protein [Enterococcus sp. MJM16]MBO0455044.1 AraC family transcriptional regulator [Enterococcus sp. MJM16]